MNLKQAAAKITYDIDREATIAALVTACLSGQRYMRAVAAASATQAESMNLWRSVEGDAVFLDAEVCETRALVYGSAKEGDNGCQLKPLRALASKQLKLSVPAANKSLKGFAANSLPLAFMT